MSISPLADVLVGSDDYDKLHTLGASMAETSFLMFPDTEAAVCDSFWCGLFSWL